MPSGDNETFSIFNNTDEDAPAGALCLWEGGFTPEGALIVVQPTADSQDLLVVAVDFTVPAKGFGKGTFANQCLVAFDATAGVPAQGDQLGSVAGSWYGSLDQTGFLCYGGSAQVWAACLRCPVPSPAPAAPTSLAATPGYQQAQLTWTAPTGAPPPQQYVVTVSLSSNLANPIQYVVTPNTSLSVQQLTNGTTYYFGVYAVNNRQASPYSNIVSAAPTASAPQLTVAPAVTGTPQVGQQLTVTNGTWTNTPTSYTIQWVSNGQFVGTNSSTYTLTTNDQANLVFAQVTANNASGSTAGNSNTVGPIAASASLSYGVGGTYTFTPLSTGLYTVELYGPGGTGSPVGPGPGGGGGGYAKSVLTLTANMPYPLVVGQGGAGQNTTFGATTVVAAFGVNGSSGGAGGTGNTGTTTANGTAGSAAVGSTGGAGGAAGGPAGGAGGAGGVSANGSPGVRPGGGGAGLGSINGGVGADGQATITW